MSKSEYATKADVEEIVGRVVGEIITDLMETLNERFDRLEAISDRHGVTLERHKLAIANNTDRPVVLQK